jgi:hypothetical protein
VTDYPAQADGIDISPVADGYVVYDRDNDVVHHLNHTAALVLELCTGQNSAADIASILEQSFPDTQGIHGYVADCVATLMGRGLIRPSSGRPSRPVPAQREEGSAGSAHPASAR